MVAHPAEEWNYGTGIDWTGKVVEKISNKTLEAYMRNNIWIPLNMKNTTFHPETLEPFLLLQMGTREGPKSPMVPGQPIYLTPAKSEVGGAGIFSTAEDYALLLAALLKEDGQFLTNETIEELVKPQLTERSRLSLKALRSDIGFPLPEIPDDIPVNHALSGLYASADIPSRRLKGAVSWEGMSSPKWLLDRSAGIALSLMVQVLPLDDDARMLWSQLEEEVYSLARSTVT
ncbi:beta-lactamase/transpeptidase-like protein [Aspergillus californicus]